MQGFGANWLKGKRPRTPREDAGFFVFLRVQIKRLLFLQKAKPAAGPKSMVYGKAGFKFDNGTGLPDDRPAAVGFKVFFDVQDAPFPVKEYHINRVAHAESMDTLTLWNPETGIRPQFIGTDKSAHARNKIICNPYLLGNNFSGFVIT